MICVKHLPALAISAACFCLAGPAYSGENVLSNEYVVLLHGLARTSRSMVPLKEKLEQSGYTVVSLSYPSRENTVRELSENYLKPEVEKCIAAGAERINFCVHSLGGIVLRQYLADHRLDRIGRVVMFGPPNQGSEVVDKLGDTEAFRLINGPAGLQLGTASNSVPNTLPPADVEVGIIAGTRSINWINSMMIPGRDDGKVSVERAKLEGMSDFVEVKKSHPFLMRDRKCIDLALRFLQTGSFGQGGKAGMTDASSGDGASGGPSGKQSKKN